MNDQVFGTGLSTQPLRVPDADDIAALVAIVGAAHAVTDDADMAAYMTEWRDRYRGSSPLVLRPGSTAEVAAIVREAAARRIAIVPQGGNTGLVGGQIPWAGRGEVVIALGRLNAIRDVDPVGNTITVEAGATLAQIQEAADGAGRLFPLSLASEGTCQIGGNLATNAGGINVLAYGNTRELTLGLEVVTAQGAVWDGLRRLRKDNTGYDLRDLFIGSEGTLGIITAAVLKLHPKPAAKATALAGVSELAAIARLFDTARRMAGPALTAFELIPRVGVEFVLRHVDGTRDPLEAPHPWYALLDISGLVEGEDVQERMEAILAAAFEAGDVADAVVAGSLSQSDELWALRENLSEVQRFEGGSIKNDISVPIAAVVPFIERANAAVADLVPGARPVPFGHFGDGNIHYNISQPAGDDSAADDAQARAAFLARWEEVTGSVNAILAEMGGSISAEHGIGRMKRDTLAETKSAVELDLMHRIKLALDPQGILNPGKVL